MKNNKVLINFFVLILVAFPALFVIAGNVTAKGERATSVVTPPTPPVPTCDPNLEKPCFFKEPVLSKPVTLGSIK